MNPANNPTDKYTREELREILTALQDVKDMLRSGTVRSVARRVNAVRKINEAVSYFEWLLYPPKGVSRG